MHPRTEQSPKVPLAKDFMSRRVACLASKTTVAAAGDFFCKHRLASAPVVDEGRIVGFISSRDCLQSLGNALFYDGMDELFVADIMKKDVRTVHEDTDIFVIENLFDQQGMHQVPVVDEHGLLVGMVGRENTLFAILTLFQKACERKEHLKMPAEVDFASRMQFAMRMN